MTKRIIQILSYTIVAVTLVSAAPAFAHSNDDSQSNNDQQKIVVHVGPVTKTPDKDSKKDNSKDSGTSKGDSGRDSGHNDSHNSGH